MHSFINALALFCFRIHSLHFCDPDHIPILIGMTDSFQQGHYAFLGIADVLHHALYGFFPILISHLKVLPEIIEDVAIGSFTLGADELDAIEMAEIVELDKLRNIVSSRNNDLILFQGVEDVEINFNRIDLDVVVEFLQFVQT